MSKMKVLYISYDGMTDPLGQSQVLPYLKELSKLKYEFHLVSFEKSDRFILHRKHIDQICKDAGIHWHPQDYHVEGGLRKTWRQIGKMKRVARYLHDKHTFNIVHCRSYIAAMAGLMLKRKYGVKMVFDMRGFWADERVDGKLWSLDNPLYKRIYNYFKKKEIEYLEEADYTISLTDCGKDEIRSWNNLNQDQVDIQVIPCCVDLNLFDPKTVGKQDIVLLKKQLGIDSKTFILGYVGSIGTWYMLDEMLDFYVQLKKTKENSKFLFVSGESPDAIKNRAKEKGLNSNDIVVTSCVHAQVPLHISIFDLSIFFIRPTFSKKASSPTKQGEIMAMGIPLVCNAGVGDTDAVVEKYKAGIVVKEFTTEAYQTALDNLDTFDQDETIKGAHEYFGLQEGVQRYLKVYKRINE